MNINFLIKALNLFSFAVSAKEFCTVPPLFCVIISQSTVSTKAEVRFHLHTADWIPQDVRQKIFEQVCFQRIKSCLLFLFFLCDYYAISSIIGVRVYFIFVVMISPAMIIFHFLVQNKNRINKAGELMVTSEMSRSQQRNLSDCIQKISTIIAEASQKPHEQTAEDLALREARYYSAAKHISFPFTPTINVSRVTSMQNGSCRLEKRNKERLNQKKIHSVIKKNRRVDFD